MHKCLDITFRNKIRNYDPATDEQILTSHMLKIPALDGTYTRLTYRSKLIIFYSRECFDQITFGDCLLPLNAQSFCQLCISNKQKTQTKGAKYNIWNREEATGGRKNLHSNNLHNFHSFTKYY